MGNVRYTDLNGGPLTGIVKALTVGQFFNSDYAHKISDDPELRRLKAENRRLTKEVHDGEKRLADMDAASLRQQWMDKASLEGMKAIRIAESAGVPIVARNISYDEAEALVKKLHLNPTQTHIFPSFERNDIENGQLKMVNGMLVLHLVFAVVGDVPEIQQDTYTILNHFVIEDPQNQSKYDEFTVGYGDERFEASYVGSTINGTDQHSARNPEFSFLPSIGVPIRSCTVTGKAIKPTPEPCMVQMQIENNVLRYQDSNGANVAVFFIGHRSNVTDPKPYSCPIYLDNNGNPLPPGVVQ